MQEGVIFPDGAEAAASPYSAGWQLLHDDDGFALDRRLRKLGWGCFFLAAEVRAWAFGWSQKRAERTAVGLFLRRVRQLDFNCAELTSIARDRFLGLPRVRVQGRARHVQQGWQLANRAIRGVAQQQTDWARL